MPGSPPPDVLIADLLETEGFAGPAAPRARAVLEQAGLTRPGKVRLVAAKVPRARQLLRERLARRCEDRACTQETGGREVVHVPPNLCEVCGGSRNRRAGRVACQALQAAGVRRVLVLGGTRSTHQALRESLDDGRVEVRCVDGTQGVRPTATVDADLAWAEILVIWASTPLPHKVSTPYTDRARGRVRMVTVARRSVAAVCQELTRLLGAPTLFDGPG